MGLIKRLYKMSKSILTTREKRNAVKTASVDILLLLIIGGSIVYIISWFVWCGQRKLGMNCMFTVMVDYYIRNI